MNGVPAAAQPASDDGLSSIHADEIVARQALLDHSSAEFLAAVPTTLIMDDLEFFSDGTYRPIVLPQAVFPSAGGEDQIMTNGCGTSTPRRQRELEDAPQRAVSPRLEGGREIANTAFVLPAVLDYDALRRFVGVQPREIANVTVNAVRVVAPVAAVQIAAPVTATPVHIVAPVTAVHIVAPVTATPIDITDTAVHRVAQLEHAVAQMASQQNSIAQSTLAELQRVASLVMPAGPTTVIAPAPSSHADTFPSLGKS